MKKSNVEPISDPGFAPPDAVDPRLRLVLERTDIQTAVKLSILVNYFREPSLREIELDHGLTRPEVGLLMFLYVQDGITAAEFCAFSGQLKGAVSRGVILLERKGLIQRQTDARDNRRQRMFITESGKEAYRVYIPILKSREEKMLSCLTKSEFKQFDALLEKLAAHVAFLTRAASD